MVVISSKGKPDITITIAGGWATCPLPYYHDLFHDGILEIPVHHRWWDRDARAWNVSARYLETLVQLVRDNYYTEPEVVRAELEKAA